MASANVITQHREMTETLTWDIKNLNSRLHYTNPGFKMTADSQYHRLLRRYVSPPMEMGCGTDMHAKWKIECSTHMSSLTVSIIFDGLLDKGASIGLHLASVFRHPYELRVSGGREGAVMKEFYSQKHDGIFTFTGQRNCHDILRYGQEHHGLWPNGNLKIDLTFVIPSDPSYGKFKGQVTPVISFFPTPNQANNNLVKCIGSLLNNPDMSDLKISCESVTFFAHKFVLAASSPVFRTMFESGLRESLESDVKIEDMRAQTLELMLRFIYMGVLDIPADSDIVLELLDCAEKYELEALKSASFAKMIQTLSNQNAGKFAVAASTYQMDKKRADFIREFCMTRHATLIKETEYRKLFVSHLQAFIPDPEPETD